MLTPIRSLQDRFASLALTRSIGNLIGRRACAGTLILVLGLLAFKAGEEGLSNFFVQSAHLEIERWSKAGQRFQADDWTRVMRYLTKSLRYSPNNSWALEELGTLQLRGIVTATDPRLALAAARSANVAFRMALTQRPTSPFVWANLALSKLYLDEQDAKLIQALGRAQELGPWEPGVQESVVYVGLAVWHRLNPAQRAAVVRTMERGAQRNAGKIAEIAKIFNRADLFCAIKNNASQGREVCNQINKSGKKSSQQ